MNKLIAGLLLGLLLGGGVTWFLLRQADTPRPGKPETTAKPDEKKEEKTNPLQLAPAKREQAGIILAKPKAAAIAAEIQGFGRVLDPASLFTLGSEMTAARAALTASEKELARAQKLFAAGGNASAQAVETAEAAAARDQAALASARSRLAAQWGREIAREAARFTEELDRGAALVRIDLLPGDSSAANAKQARVIMPGTTASFIAEIIGAAPMADGQIQGASFLALVRQPGLPAGAALRAIVPGAGEPMNALVIPSRAVVYHQGNAWIYVLGEENTFERKLVALGRGTGSEEVAITSGVEPDEQVVTTGAQQLLAAELQAGQAAEP